MGKRVDSRPICTCGAYDFPHRVGGRCDGSAFAEYMWYYDNQYCQFCNCNNNNQCEVVTGQESIKEAECFAFCEDYYLPLQPDFE